MSAQDVFCRLYPYAPRLGFHVQTYAYRGQKYRGGERPTFYIVDEDLAAELAELKQVESDPDSKPLFQFFTDQEEKERIEKMETEKYLAALGAVVNTVSLPRDLQPPGTTDLTKERAAPEPAPAREVVEEGASKKRRGGRSAALPPTRAPSETGTASLGGAITSEDTKEQATSDEGE
jgi:hypothetical protein